ncbi:MAG: type IV pilus secretin PilQ [Deltaproteobacteria bacterium]|nr:type IV pilus secretin PilQ [Candidatus Anaeroferrophillacea bacterium]
MNGSRAIRGGGDVGRRTCGPLSVVVLLLALLLLPAAGRGDDDHGGVGTGLQRRVGIACQDTDLRAILRALAGEAGINLILSGDVPAATVSLNFQDISIESAMKAILASHKLGLIAEDEVYRVVKAEEVVARGEDLVTEFIPFNYGKGGDIMPQLEGLLSERGRLRCDARTNTLVVRDQPGQIAAVREMLAVLDVPTPQVMIDARIVMAESKAVHELGIQWGGSWTDQRGNDTTYTAAGSVEGGSFADTAINLPVPSAASALTFGISKLDSYSFNVRLSALEEMDRIRILSNPRVMVLDNHQAKIGQGKEIPYVSSDVDNPDTEFKEAELSLVVTPHVTRNGEITLELEINNDSQGENTAQGEPIINTQNVNTTLLVHDGETAAIGGIILANNVKESDGVPVVSRLPLLGNLFKHKMDEDSRSELMVFITPTVVKR